MPYIMLHAEYLRCMPCRRSCPSSRRRSRRPSDSETCQKTTCTCATPDNVNLCNQRTACNVYLQHATRSIVACNVQVRHATETLRRRDAAARNRHCDPRSRMRGMRPAEAKHGTAQTACAHAPAQRAACNTRHARHARATAAELVHEHRDADAAYLTAEQINKQTDKQTNKQTNKQTRGRRLRQQCAPLPARARARRRTIAYDSAVR